MYPHLPALLVLIPLIAAPVCILLRNSRLLYLLSILVSWSTLFIALTIFLNVINNGVITYEFGGWSIPYGIEYRIDILSGFILILVALIASITITFSLNITLKELGEDRLFLFYSLINLLIAGLLGIVITGDLFNVFVFLEISSLASYSLVALGSNNKALISAFRYLILGTLGATFILIGIGLLYSATGTLNMSDIAVRIDDQLENRVILSAFAFLMVGICLKAALFPLHTWLPGAYAYAPSIVTALLAGTATKVSAYLMLRLVIVFGPTFLYSNFPITQIIIYSSLLGILAGSALALAQTDAKKILAYSSVAHIGYVLLGIGLGGTLGLTGSLVHIFGHSLAKCAAFLAIAAAVMMIGSSELSHLKGLGKKMPWTMSAFVLSALSLIGIPLTAGFLGKWYLINAALNNGWWWIALSLVLAGALSVVYLWKIIEHLYFQTPEQEIEKVTDIPVVMLIPLWFLAGASIYFGIETSFNVGFSTEAARLILGIMN